MTVQHINLHSTMSQPTSQSLFFEDDQKSSTSKTQKKLTATQRKSLRLKNTIYKKMKTEMREKKLVHRRLESITNKLITIKELIDANENEHDLFGKQVAASLKFLPLQLSIQLQNRIQNVINEFNQTHDVSVPVNMMSCTQNENQEEEVEVPETPTNDHNALESTPQRNPPLHLPINPKWQPISQQVQMAPMNTLQTMKYLSSHMPQLIGQQFILNQSQKPLILEVGPLNSIALKPLVTVPSTTVNDEKASVLKDGGDDGSDDSEDEEIEIKEEPMCEIDDAQGDPLQAFS